MGTMMIALSVAAMRHITDGERRRLSLLEKHLRLGPWVLTRRFRPRQNISLTQGAVLRTKKPQVTTYNTRVVKELNEYMALRQGRPGQTGGLDKTATQDPKELKVEPTVADGVSTQVEHQTVVEREAPSMTRPECFKLECQSDGDCANAQPFTKCYSGHCLCATFMGNRGLAPTGDQLDAEACQCAGSRTGCTRGTQSPAA